MPERPIILLSSAADEPAAMAASQEALMAAGDSSASDKGASMTNAMIVSTAYLTHKERGNAGSQQATMFAVN